jgi:hypothetical protein
VEFDQPTQTVAFAPVDAGAVVADAAVDEAGEAGVDFDGGAFVDGEAAVDAEALDANPAVALDVPIDS